MISVKIIIVFDLGTSTLSDVRIKLIHFSQFWIKSWMDFVTNFQSVEC